MEAVVLPIIGLLIIITLMILFYSKKHIINSETKIYSKMLLLSFFFVLIGLITFIVAKMTNDFTLIAVFQKIYMSILVLLNYFSIEYCLKLFKTEKELGYIHIPIVIATIISIILIFILPLNVIFYDNVLDGNGKSYNITIVNCVISFVFFIILTIYLIIKKQKIKKILPFVILVILYIVGLILRNVYPELIFEGFFYSYILLVMYNTIENPDIKIISELQFNKLLLEKENNVVKNGFNELAIKLKTPLLEFYNFANSNISKDKELESLNAIKNKSMLLIDEINSIIDIIRIENNVLDNNMNYYKTSELFDSINEIITNKKMKVVFDISKDIPTTLYGNINQIKQIIIYLTNFISKSFTNARLSVIISKIQVGNICKLKFNFVLPISTLNSNIELKKINNTYELNTDNIEYMLYQKLIEQYNNKCSLDVKDNNIYFNFQLYNKVNANYIEDKINNKKVTYYFDASQKRILILDDNRKNIKLIVDMLKSYNVNIDIATNIEELITQISGDKTYDLILYSDTVNVIKEYTVNNENVLQIISRIKLVAGYKIPIVILGNKKYKNVDYIIKPIDENELNVIMLRYLEDIQCIDGEIKNDKR